MQKGRHNHKSERLSSQQPKTIAYKNISDKKYKPVSMGRRGLAEMLEFTLEELWD